MRTNLLIFFLSGDSNKRRDENKAPGTTRDHQKEGINSSRSS